MARAKKSVAAPPAHGEAPSPAYLMSPEWLCTVGNNSDNDIRAHQVALTYHHLAIHLDDLVHADGQRRTNANWFNFGLWGTLTVTQAIGNDRPLPRLNGGAMPFRRAMTPTVLRVKASRGQEVARALAWAQLLIFVSTCNAFRLFAASDAGRSAPFSDDDLIRSLDELDLPARVVDPIGVHRRRHAAAIAEAFRYYARARQAADAGVRAKFILGGNLLLTEIEQDIADRAVSVVLDLVPRSIGEALDWRLARLAQRFRGVPTHFSYLVLPFLHADERRAVDAVWSRFMTDQVLVMALPTETLRVGRDIPPLHRAAPYYPADLVFKSDLSDLETNLTCTHGHDSPTDCTECTPILRDLQDVATRVRSLDRTVGNGRGSAARDWRRWDERMNWALTLLRSRQHDDTLFWRPYTTRDEHRILGGDLPRRSGDPSALDVQPPAGFEGIAVDPFIRDRTDGL